MIEQIGGTDCQLVEVRFSLEMPQKISRAAADIENRQGLAGPRPTGSPLADIIGQSIVTRLAQTVALAPVRIDAECPAGVRQRTLAALALGSGGALHVGKRSASKSTSIAQPLSRTHP